MSVKNFVIIALGFLGDTLLVEPLCRNLKNNYPNSKIIFIANKPFVDIAKGFETVDKVYAYDKKKNHKGFVGYLKFKKEFTEKNIDTAIITHPHERSILVAKMTGAKNIISLPAKKSPLNIFVNKKRRFITEELRKTYKAEYNNGYLNSFCSFENFPVQYKRFDINEKEILEKFKLPQNYIVLSPISKDLVKDWDYENIKKFVLNANKTVVLVGTDKAKTIADNLKAENIDFIDLTLQTNITELGAIIKNSDACVSVDTGTFHFSYAQNVPTIGLFFNEKMVKEWAPSELKFVQVHIGEKELKNREVICHKNIDSVEIIKSLDILIKENF